MLTPEDIEKFINNAPKSEVRQSGIDGYGLFAKELILEAEQIIDFSFPHFYQEVRYADQTDEFLREGKFIGISEEICLTAEGSTKFAAVNHSRNPNAVVDLEKRQVFALRDIQPNEEITIDVRLEPMSERAKQFSPWL
ncbi:SET domain-containing protein-lysine N-methyltransferase [Nostoc sp. 'Peltigera membranacea cyanobiont' N6]|uniref:SET domain-containing protein-lysine N-methyltransferase n=1 Tax=Nostoc sp. 'Peltigera membranacea cyanobiont' N6 TaxID=1261031 RepID=UPI000CF35E60|nr:SET domain-containing protein [Nostoc sp. 'Peltigera membranacea cyanobiont' N6]AVH63266.1 SET domain protein [Nostoc sp. 'Peltigera membranacea cyanobiont' N6]